jgi:hypothetical protein
VTVVAMTARSSGAREALRAEREDLVGRRVGLDEELRIPGDAWMVAAQHLRMSMRRFGRFTKAFSKKLANHAAAIGLHYMHCNFRATTYEPRQAHDARDGGRH